MFSQMNNIEQIRELKKAMVANIRFQKETGGIVIAGKTVKTDRESQAQLNAAYTALKNGFVANVNWKTDFVALTLEDIEPIAQAVSQHVQNCFTKEMQHLVNLGNINQLHLMKAYDIETNW